MQIEIKRLLKEIAVHKRTLTIVAIAGIINATGKGQISLYMKEVMDASSAPDRLKSISIIGIILALTIATSRYFHIYLMNIIAEKTAQSLRQKLQFKFMNLSLKFHNTYSAGSGGLISRILNDIRVIQDGLRMFADLFSAPLVFIFLIFNLFFLDWKLAASIFIIVPFLIIFLKKISVGLRKYVLNGQEQLETLTATIKESLDGVRTIQSFNLQKLLSFKLFKEAEDYISIRKKVHKRVEIMGPVNELLATFILLAIIYYFSSQISVGATTAGTLIAFITAMLQINEPIKKFQESYVRIQETIVAAKRVYSLLDEDSEVPQIEKPLNFPLEWSKIEYRNVSFKYAEDLVLNNFSLTIKRGEFIALVGESGSGKSTVINLLSRFYDPNEGDIFIDEINIKQIDLKQLRDNIALVSQDVFLFNDTVKMNIVSGKEDVNNEKIKAVLAASNAQGFVDRLPHKIDSLVGERGGLLSGGEKQRLSIARALYKDSPILVLDEATSALDTASELEVQKGLDQLMKGRTSLVIAHRLSTIQKADRIVVMKKGQILEMGQHETLLATQGAYYNYIQLQRMMQT